MPALDYIPGQTECIHLIFPNPDGMIVIGAPQLSASFTNGQGGGMHTIACQPHDAVRPKMFSSETAAVNCPLCKATADFERIKSEQNGGLSEADRKAREFALKVTSPKVPEQMLSAIRDEAVADAARISETQ